MNKSNSSSEGKNLNKNRSNITRKVSFIEKVKESGYRCQQETKDGYTTIHLMPLEYLIRNNWRY
ncbi:MAG: hypothetical protein ACJ748_17195 [Flavisolibacter sp.]